MERPAGDEASATAPRSGSQKKRYYYYINRNLRATRSGDVFVCDHVYDCDPLYREASEQEVVAYIGAELLRLAQDECGWNGLGSTCLMVYPVLDDETGEEVRVVTKGKKRWVLSGWAEVAGEKAVEDTEAGERTAC